MSLGKIAGKERLKPIDGNPPDLLKKPAGCPFAKRCPNVMKVCTNNLPEHFNISKNHSAACWMLHYFCKEEMHD